MLLCFLVDLFIIYIPSFSSIIEEFKLNQNQIKIKLKQIMFKKAKNIISKQGHHEGDKGANCLRALMFREPHKDRNSILRMEFIRL